MFVGIRVGEGPGAARCAREAYLRVARLEPAVAHPHADALAECWWPQPRGRGVPPVRGVLLQVRQHVSPCQWPTGVFL